MVKFFTGLNQNDTEKRDLDFKFNSTFGFKGV